MMGEPDSAGRRWATVRLVLGVAQMIGASIGAVLLAVAGVTPWSLGVAVAATVLTAVSIVLFARHQDDASQSRK